MTCSVDGCDRSVRALGMCKLHWQRTSRNGTPGPAGLLYGRDPLERIWRFIQVDQASGCWVFTGTRNSLGYGKFNRQSAHRFMYERLIGPIPDGLTIDHMCRVPSCVNPAHLDPVTMAENLRRRSLAYTHCKRGHDITNPENYRLTSFGGRDCRACDRLRRAKAKEAKI